MLWSITEGAPLQRTMGRRRMPAETGFADAYERRAYAKLFLKEYPGMLADATRSIQISPRRATAHSTRCLAHYYLGDFASAPADSTRAIEVGTRTWLLDKISQDVRPSTSMDESARMPLSNNEARILRHAVARLRAAVMAVTFGATGGAGLFLATAWLVAKGGVNVGQHLRLLNAYLPGYSVTWSGALLGLVYGALVGAAVGAAVAWTYNLVASIRGTDRNPPA